MLMTLLSKFNTAFPTSEFDNTDSYITLARFASEDINKLYSIVSYSDGKEDVFSKFNNSNLFPNRIDEDDKTYFLTCHNMAIGLLHDLLIYNNETITNKLGIIPMYLDGDLHNNFNVYRYLIDVCMTKHTQEEQNDIDETFITNHKRYFDLVKEIWNTHLWLVFR
jgi:hypothetical protein